MSQTAIVIPTLNRAAMLREAIDSALSAEPARIVVVDCGSSDGTEQLVRSYGPRVEFVSGSFPNPAAARNAGTAHVREEYLGFLDSDDVMLPGKISDLERALRSDPEVVLAHGALEVFDAAGETQPERTATFERRRRHGESIGTSYPELARYCLMYTSATLIRRAALERVGGYDETLTAYEDWDLYLRLSLTGRLAYVDSTVARYRLWEGNTPWDQTANGVVHVARKHLSALDQVPREQRKEVAAAFQRRIAASLYTLLDLRGARRAALASLRLAPRESIRSPDVRRVLTRSLLPRSVLKRRRPSGSPSTTLGGASSRRGVL